ncbi:oligosaccharide flippase family protein [Helicovermis profundi]|uniref:Oligosaccharide flippase family protein n=1 Tax=Helicovermis profundi TaxID=3065157 RepID=A0AAU9EV74_9FIRM|nr:oligosaccharide flippase family protein [Clostridia bacterium S502]
MMMLKWLLINLRNQFKKTPDVINYFHKLLTSQYFYYIGGEIISKTVNFLVIILISRIISPSDYGYISIAYSVIPILLVLYSLNIPSSIIRRFYENQNDYLEFLLTNTLFITLNSFFLTVIIFLFSDSICNILNIPQDLLRITAVVAFFKVFYEFYRAFLQANQNGKIYAKFTVIYNVMLNVSIIIILFNIDNYRYMSKSYSDLFTSSIFFIYIIYRLIKVTKWRPQIEHLKYAILFGAPLILHTISNVVLGQIDRFMINSIVGTSETGVYSLAYNLGMIMNVIIIAVNKAWLPIFYKHVENKEYLENKLKRIIGFIFISAAILITYGSYLLNYVIDYRYLDAITIFPIIVISYTVVFGYIIYSNYSYFYKKTILIARNSIIASIINIILNYYLLRVFDYRVAAVTTLISYTILFILNWYAAKQLVENNVVSIKIYIVSLLYFILFSLIVSLINSFFSGMLTILLNSIFLLCFIVDFKRKNYF